MLPTDIRAFPERGLSQQPPPPPRQRSRRLTVASIVATVVLSILATVLGPLGVLPSAEAAPGAPDVTWRISSEPAEARSGYAAMLNGIRTAVSAGRVRPDGGPAVNVTDAAGTNTFVTVDLHAEGLYDFVRVFMRRSDNYVMGWRWGTEDADDSSQVTWHDFFTLDAAVDLPDAVRTGAGANVNPRFEGLANYSDLQQQGANREGMQITPSSLDNAVFTLAGGASATTRNAASAILQIIVAVAEGSRFRNQAAATATAFGNGQPFTVDSQFMAQQNSWATMSRALLIAAFAGVAVLTAPIEVGAITFATTAALAAALMTAYHSDQTKNRKLTQAADDTTTYVEPDAFGDSPTIQSAIDSAPSNSATQHTILIAPGTYHETIGVPANKPNLFIRSSTGKAADVVITADRAHGTLKADGTEYGTEGSAVATFKADGVTVTAVTIQNTFDPKAHPEISPYETQAVAVAAEGDRQVFSQDRIISTQDTVLAKSPVPTAQDRQYFVGSYIEGSIDFIFGNATAVFDRDNIAMRNWTGGTILAPNTVASKKYGILVTGSTIYTNGVPANTMYLGRPWHNAADVSPQAVVRDTTVNSGITAAHPWTDMTTDYSWTQARFKEYDNTGPGAGVGANAPQLTASEAADYTAQKYLAGTDGWNPVF